MDNSNAVPVQAGGTAYISFSAEIIPHTTESLLALCSQLANKKVAEVYLMISTPGGQVMSGLHLFNVLKAMPFELITHNVGNIDSIGNVVFLAGEKRYACPQSKFMFHGVGFNLGNGVRLQEKILRERLDAMLSEQKRIGEIIRQRTGIDETEIEGLFREAQTKDANYAARCGIINEIRDVHIPPGAPIFSLVFKR